jgi:pimeloyl-ACP methyl ester carboxylesterase
LAEFTACLEDAKALLNINKKSSFSLLLPGHISFIFINLHINHTMFAVIHILWFTCSVFVASAAPASSIISLDPDGLIAHNNFDCRSAAHPNPVVLLHGLGATFYEDLNYLQGFLQAQDFCTFSVTYGDYKDFPLVGGLKPISESSIEIASFIKDVQNKTAASKIDLVGHSEGAFQALYVPKIMRLYPIIDKVVAIAPPTHGTTFAGLYEIAILGGNLTRDVVSTVLDTVGCGACSDLVTGAPAVLALNDGHPIAQPGNTLTIITSRADELVTPTSTCFVNEPNVSNIYVQDFCPFDPVGHIGEAYDLNVWNMVLNALESAYGRKFPCVIGSPGR